jgi:tight adherence protein C
MAERSGVEELRSLAVLLIQTDRLGTSVAQALRVHAEALRMRFHHQAEARAARATVQLAFPLVFCIFPALLAVVVGPAAVKLLSAIGGKP